MQLAARALRIADKIRTPKIIRSVQVGNLTYLDRTALMWLAQQVTIIERDKIAGRILETGCALGGSSIVIASSKKPERPFDVYDVFGQIPAPSEKDGSDVHRRYKVIASGQSAGISGDPYYGYQTDLLGKVRNTFEQFGFPPERHSIRLIRGLYEDTLHVEGPVAFAHIDCDWYDSVKVCLQRIVPSLAPGGRVVIDDYFAYSGCRAAVWDYFRPRMEEFQFTYGPRLLITRYEGAPSTAPR